MVDCCWGDVLSVWGEGDWGGCWVEFGYCAGEGWGDVEGVVALVDSFEEGWVWDARFVDWISGAPGVCSCCFVV